MCHSLKTYLIEDPSDRFCYLLWAIGHCLLALFVHSSTDHARHLQSTTISTWRLAANFASEYVDYMAGDSSEWTCSTQGTGWCRPLAPRKNQLFLIFPPVGRRFSFASAYSVIHCIELFMLVHWLSVFLCWWLLLIVVLLLLIVFVVIKICALFGNGAMSCNKMVTMAAISEMERWIREYLCRVETRNQYE